MYPTKISQILDLTGGKISGQVNLSAPVTGSSIDSREICLNDVFFALAGSSVCGSEYGADALRKGANLVVVNNVLSGELPYPHMSVPAVEIALAQLAAQNRNFSDALVIGITGSVGKTTTRSMIATVLKSVYQGVESPRSFNNHLGVPLTLLQLSDGDEFAAVEIGSSAPGEIAALSDIVRPEFGVVTRIAPAHLNAFHSVEGVRLDKEQLIRSLPKDGVAFLNADDTAVARMAAVSPCRVVSFGADQGASVRMTSIQPVDSGLKLTVDGTTLHVPVCGRHNGTAIMAAIAVGLEVGIPLQQIAETLGEYQPQPGRCQVQKIGPWTVIDDTYNSSPVSVAAAIRSAEEFSSCHHRILVLGDMLDLGEQAPDLHFGIGASIVPRGIDHVLVSGKFSDDVVEGFLTAGGSLNRISTFPDLAHLYPMLECLASDSDVIIVKGSRATSMDRVVSELSRLSSDQPPAQRRAA